MKSTGRTSETEKLLGELTDFWRTYFPHMGKAVLMKKDERGGFLSKRVYGGSPRTRYDFDVLPGPYWGDVLNARVYLLYLNPTPDWVKIDDGPSMKKVIPNLLQEDGVFPQLMDGSLPGHRRWTTLFRHIDASPYVLARNVCVVNLIPWASYSFDDRPWVFTNEITVKIIFLIRRLAWDKRKLFIVCRRPEIWGLGNDENVFTFSPIQRRGIHLKQKGLDLTPTIEKYIHGRV